MNLFLTFEKHKHFLSGELHFVKFESVNFWYGNTTLKFVPTAIQKLSFRWIFRFPRQFNNVLKPPSAASSSYPSITVVLNMGSDAPLGTPWILKWGIAQELEVAAIILKGQYDLTLWTFIGTNLYIHICLSFNLRPLVMSLSSLARFRLIWMPYTVFNSFRIYVNYQLYKTIFSNQWLKMDSNE